MVLIAIRKPNCSASKLVRIKWFADSRRHQGRELYVQFHLRVSVNEQGAVGGSQLLQRRGKSRTSINRALAPASPGHCVGSHCETRFRKPGWRVLTILDSRTRSRIVAPP
jgi:hypothetical protein